MVKMSPEAMEQPAEAPVDTMLFSRMPPRPRAPSRAIETTAAGMAEAMVRPAKRPMYALPAPSSIASRMARMMARTLNWGGFGDGDGLIEGSGARLKRPLEYARCQPIRKRDDPLSAEQMFQRRRERLQKEGLGGHELDPHPVAFEGLRDHGSHGRNPGGGERGAHNVRGCEAEQPFHLGCARERYGIDAARLQALQQLMHSLVVGRIRVHVGGDSRYLGSRVPQEIDEPLIRLCTVKLKSHAPAGERLTAEARDDAIGRRRFRGDVRLQAELAQ